jgi:hypothetical protein
MGISPHVLYSCLQADLLSVIPGYDLDFPEGESPDFWPDISDSQVAGLQLLRSILKKYKGSKSSDADQLALDKFLMANQKCDRPYAIDVTNLTEIQAVAIGETKKLIHDFWFNRDGDYAVGLDQILPNLGVGPGASVGAVGESFYQKVACSLMTGTSPQLHSLYQRACAMYNLWSETEKIRSDHMGVMAQVDSNKLSYVPKTAKISRTICTEPLLNMLFQKGVGFAMEMLLEAKCGIQLAHQQVLNAELARIGSITGEFGTIDLSSASDTISLGLCRELLPPYIMGWLSLCRSPNTLLPDGRKVQLHMVSSMGNAFTFPLQTILFSSLVQGCYSALGIKRFNNSRGPVPTGRKDQKGRDSFKLGHRPGNWAVYGDDIIVRREAYDLVVNLLERFGFTVNLDKSYNYGPFRESCGSDFWNGNNVRGIYCDELETAQDCYSLINRLNVWSANHGIPLPTTIRFLMASTFPTSQVRPKGQTRGRFRKLEFLPVPPWETDTAGIKVPENLLIKRPVKESKEYQGTYIYARYTPRQRSFNLIDLESRPLKPHKGWNNPSGVILAAVGGYLRDGRITERQRFVHYKKRLASAPCWDWRDPSNSTLTSLGWQRFLQDVVRVNLELD